MKPQRDSYSCKGIVSLGIFEEKWMSSTSEYVALRAPGTQQCVEYCHLLVTFSKINFVVF